MERLLVFSPTKSLHVIPKRHSALYRFRPSGDLTTEIRVCTNRSCRKQGSFQTLETLSGLAPPEIAVVSCGCLGRCGAGPNLVALPAAVIVSHCATAARSAEVMAALYGGGGNGRSFDAKTSLEALALRKKAEKLSEVGEFAAAESLLSQAMELKPMGGIHILYKDRGVARLALNMYHEALGDATDALTMFPRFVEGYICQGDAFLALNQIDSAEKSYLTALDIDPSIRRSKSFKARIAMLQEKLSSAKT